MEPPVSAQGLSPEPRVAGTAVAALKDLCGPCCMCSPSWSLLKLALQVPQREVAGQTTTLFPCRVQGTGVQPSLGSLHQSHSRWGRLVPKPFPRKVPSWEHWPQDSLAAGIYHKLPLQSPLPFLPFCSNREGQWPWCLVQPGVRCGITLPELYTQFGLSKTNLRAPVTNKENSLLPAN